MGRKADKMFCIKTSVNTKAEYDELFGAKENYADNAEKPEWIVKDTIGNITYTATPTKEKCRLQKIEKALEKAHDIRKFEIDKYWSRATYFWAFTASVYVAYFHVLKDLHCGRHGKISLVVLAALGLFFSFSWWMSSRGSRHWQENWENHVMLLENDVMGPLYKTFLSGDAPSITKVNEAGGMVMSVCGFFLLFYEFTEFYKENCIWGERYIFLSILTAIFTGFALFVYAKSISGNAKKTEHFTFSRRVFEDKL